MMADQNNVRHNHSHVKTHTHTQRDGADLVIQFIKSTGLPSIFEYTSKKSAHRLTYPPSLPLFPTA